MPSGRVALIGLAMVVAAAGCGGRSRPIGLAALPPAAAAPAVPSATDPGGASAAPPSSFPSPAGSAAVVPDQPIGLGFGPPPASLADLHVPDGHGHSLSLTFDDGPSAQFTPEVLALLDQAHVPAVFCLIGRQAAALPSLVRQEVTGGYRLCDHSRDHDLHMQPKGAAFEAAEVADGLHAIQHTAPGSPVTFYRQPGGLWDPAVVQAMYQAGLTPLRWSDDPRDWSRPGTVAIAQRVLARLQPGAVVLLHDGGGDRTQTVQALTWLLQALPAAGWTFTLPTPQHLSPEQASRPE